MAIHQRTHPTFVVGCKPCKWSTLSFGTVPGASQDARIGASQLRQRESDLHRYRDKRQAGERPDGTTKAAMDKYDRRVDAWEQKESQLVDDNPPEVVGKLKSTTFNERNN